jgi:phosphatidylglycerol:prolipoprotein diacylglycerol transferase
MIYINVDPVAFHIGSYSIRWYGIMVALAVLTIVTWLVLWARNDPRIKINTAINAAIVGIPSGVIFSRLLHVIDNWSYYWNNPSKIIGGDGLTIWGAVLGAAIGIWIYSRISKHSFAHIADVMAPGIILAQAVGRVGCTLNGCCYGSTTDMWCAVVYTQPNSEGPIGIPVHPTQVYEIIYNLIVFGILLALRKRFKPDGSLFIIYLMFYSVWRLSIDFIRDGTPFLFGLHQAQVIGIIVLIVCIILLIVRHTRWVKKGEKEAAVKSKKAKT